MNTLTCSNCGCTDFSGMEHNDDFIPFGFAEKPEPLNEESLKGVPVSWIPCWQNEAEETLYCVPCWNNSWDLHLHHYEMEHLEAEAENEPIRHTCSWTNYCPACDEWEEEDEEDE